VSAAAHPVPEEPAPLGRRPKLELVGRSPAVDLDRAERAVAELLAALGQDPTSEQLLDTPRRVAASYAELLTPAPVTRTTFPNDEGYAELVLTRAIPFASRGRRLRPDLGPARPGPERPTFAAGILALTGISR
jgi:hypothetical protein